MIQDQFGIDHAQQLIVEHSDNLITVFDGSSHLYTHLSDSELVVHAARSHLLYSVGNQPQQHLYVFDQHSQMADLLAHLSSRHALPLHQIRCVHKNSLVTDLHPLASQTIKVALQTQHDILVHGTNLYAIQFHPDMPVSNLYSQMSLHLKVPPQCIYLSTNGQYLDTYRFVKDYFLHSATLIHYLVYRNLKLTIHHPHGQQTLFLLPFQPLT